MFQRGIIICFFIISALANAAHAFELSPLGIDIHAFASQGFLVSDHNSFLSADTEDGAFQFNEVGINFNKQLTENLHVGLQFLARDQGAIGNNEVEIDWAYGDYRWRDWLGVRAGIMRLPLGLYNETRDLDFLRTSILLPQSVYNENLRDFFSRLRGVGLYGNIPLKAAGDLGYQAMVGTVDIDSDGGVARSSESSGLVEFIEADVGTVYNGSLQWYTPIEGLRAGVSCFYNSDVETEIKVTVPMGPGMPTEITATDEQDEFYVYVLSAEYTWEHLVVAAEYMEMKRKSRVRGFPMEFELNPVGYYLGGSYRFTDWFELGSYYSIYYADEDEKDGDDLEAMGQPDFRAWLKDFAVTTRFDLNDNCILKLEGHVMDGAALLMAQDHPDGFEKNWFLLTAKVTFYF